NAVMPPKTERPFGSTPAINRSPKKPKLIPIASQKAKTFASLLRAMLNQFQLARTSSAEDVNRLHLGIRCRLSAGPKRKPPNSKMAQSSQSVMSKKRGNGCR
ncbi:MAG: hypothetical protein GY805_35425, partial [Chloroflexi bacterium]|nr:hypothetical protein [Chloroflexota bacterium]